VPESAGGEEPCCLVGAELLVEVEPLTSQLDLDDALTPETAMQVLDPVIALLQDLTEPDRQALAELINQCAHQETDPERHLTAWETPQTLGLLT
jgi:hypothetical protein